MPNPDIASIEALLSIPDEQYMNPQQLAFFQHLLEQQLAHIHDNAAETGKHLRKHEEFPDPTDRATQEEWHSLELRTHDRERKSTRHWSVSATVYTGLLRRVPRAYRPAAPAGPTNRYPFAGGAGAP